MRRLLLIFEQVKFAYFSTLLLKIGTKKEEISFKTSSNFATFFYT